MLCKPLLTVFYKLGNWGKRRELSTIIYVSYLGQYLAHKKSSKMLG